MSVDKFRLGSFRGRMRTLHLAWLAFFLSFVVWFNAAPLLQAIAASLGVSQEEILVLAMVNVALAVPARVVVGMLTDRYGPRRVYSLLLALGALPCFWFALADSLREAALARFFMGIVGAGFVVGIRLVGEWFGHHELGTAEGIYGGWGNFGSAAAALALPALALWVGGENGWRWAVACTGVLSLGYALVFHTLVRDTPSGATYFKPRRASAMEVSSVGDLLLLLVMKLPMYLCLGVLAWRLSPAGFGLIGAAALQAILVGLAILLVVDFRHVWRCNAAVRRAPLPELQRYRFKQVAILGLLYFTTFGSELAVVSVLPLFFANTFGLGPVQAGAIAASFAFMNLVARPMGGWLSDRHGRKRTLLRLVAGVALGYAAMSLITAQWSLWLAVGVVVGCSFFVQAGAGAVFATVPLIKRSQTGQIAGMTGAYGNVGAVLYLLVLTFFGYAAFFMVIALTALVGYGLALVFMDEPRGVIAELDANGNVELIKVG
ncbi:MAG TPA: NarK family nitrate/nitrite MFS transporter [Hyphomicrobiales bacterium]|nr:NarK family nitrate/nitrite MFS transporter [Hyphomicrobiales bacterium]